MMINENSIYCIYMTPCNYCAKFDKWCDKRCNDRNAIEKAKNETKNEATGKILNPAGEYAVKFAKNHGMSIAEAMEQPMVKARFDVFNATGK